MNWPSNCTKPRHMNTSNPIFEHTIINDRRKRWRCGTYNPAKRAQLFLVRSHGSRRNSPAHGQHSIRRQRLNPSKATPSPGNSRSRPRSRRGRIASVHCSPVSLDALLARPRSSGHGSNSNPLLRRLAANFCPGASNSKLLPGNKKSGAVNGCLRA